VIFSGKAGVEVNGKSVAEIQQGQFIGEMGFITDEVPLVDIVAIEPTRCMWWSKSKLQDFLKNNPELRAAFQRTFGSICKYFCLSQLVWCYWHPVGRGQGCC